MLLEDYVEDYMLYALEKPSVRSHYQTYPESLAGSLLRSGNLYLLFTATVSALKPMNVGHNNMLAVQGGAR